MSEFQVVPSSGTDAAWSAFADGITAYLLMMDVESGDGDALIVEVTGEHAVERGGAYVQFCPEDVSTVRTEIIGDESLAPHRPMRDDTAVLLVNEGWSGNDRTDSNWWRAEPTKDLAGVHAVISRALWVLRHEFGVKAPVELSCQSWGAAYDEVHAGRITAPYHDERFPDMLENLEAFLREHLGCSGPFTVAAKRPSTPALPTPRLVKSAAEAETYAAKVMETLGFTRVHTTPAGADGGVDVTSNEGMAQVKMEGVLTGRPVLQSIYGLASLARKESLVFSLAGYTNQACEWAREAGIALFEFRYDGSLEGRSPYAQELLKHGFQRRPEARVSANKSANAALPAGGQTLVSQLQALAELHQAGALTAAEYVAAKAKLLS